MDQRVEELHERFSSWEITLTEDRAQCAALVTCFNTFEARYYAVEEERHTFEQVEREGRSFEAEQFNEWMQCRSFEETEQAQRCSFEDEQRVKWMRVAK